jgi:hypothetical protein
MLLFRLSSGEGFRCVVVRDASPAFHLSAYNGQYPIWYFLAEQGWQSLSKLSCLRRRYFHERRE